MLEHDINVGNALPIKQHAYRVNMTKGKVMKTEARYFLDNGLAKPRCSPWSSPCLVNAVPDSFPLPGIEDCIDNIGSAAYVSKLDLLKGYWQVPLTQRASAFVAPDHFL